MTKPNTNTAAAPALTNKELAALQLEAIAINEWLNTCSLLDSINDVSDDYAAHVVGDNRNKRLVTSMITGGKMRRSNQEKVIISKPETLGGALDRALIEGATMDDLKAIRGAVNEHIAGIRRIFGKDSIIKSAGGVYSFVRPL